MPNIPTNHATTYTNTRNSVNFVCLSVVLKSDTVFYQGPKFYNTLNTNINNFPPSSLKEHLSHLFVIIISILSQKVFVEKKLFNIQHFLTSLTLTVILILHLLIFCIRHHNFYTILEKL